MFCPLFPRLTVIDSATVASCIGSLLRRPSLYSNSGEANDSGSVSDGIAGGGSAAIGGCTDGNGATIGAAALAGIRTNAGGIGAAAGPPMGIDRRIRAGASGRLLCPPFSGLILSKSSGKESSKSPGSLRYLPNDGSVSDLVGSMLSGSSG